MSWLKLEICIEVYIVPLSKFNRSHVIPFKDQDLKELACPVISNCLNICSISDTFIQPKCAADIGLWADLQTKHHGQVVITPASNWEVPGLNLGQ
jgi:hypothetical protein